MMWVKERNISFKWSLDTGAECLGGWHVDGDWGAHWKQLGRLFLIKTSWVGMRKIISHWQDSSAVIMMLDPLVLAAHEHSQFPQFPEVYFEFCNDCMCLCGAIRLARPALNRKVGSSSPFIVHWGGGMLDLHCSLPPAGNQDGFYVT